MKSSPILWVAGMLTGWVLASLIAGSGPGRVTAGGQEPAPEKGTQEIPLKSIYTTSEQEGLQRIAVGGELKPDGTVKYDRPYGHSSLIPTAERAGRDAS